MQSSVRIWSRLSLIIRPNSVTVSKYFTVPCSKQQQYQYPFCRHRCFHSSPYFATTKHEINHQNQSDLKISPDDNDKLLESEDLTEEEKKILAELEEEERKLRESFMGKWDNDEEDFSVWDPDASENKSQQLAQSVSEGHVPFENQSRVIQDVIDEMWNPLPEKESAIEEPTYYPRGKTGVFDLGELVDLLNNEGANELVAIALPKELEYADYMVIITVGNNRQLKALATFVRKRYKVKDRKETDVLPRVEKNRKYEGWIALDLGNIILQIFLQETRDYYDLETLWTVGPAFDDLTHAADSDIVRLLNSIK